jgi:hypothetical protein
VLPTITEHRLKVSGNRILKRTFGSMKRKIKEAGAYCIMSNFIIFALS